MRLSKDAYYLEIARAVAKRSTCLRRQYGAVIVRHDEIVSTGYNGAARGFVDCMAAGICFRMQIGIPHGEQCEKCLAVHAEQNAMLSASRARMLRNAGIRRVVNRKRSWNVHQEEVVVEHGCVHRS
jgi:dCMP deaminase